MIIGFGLNENGETFSCYDNYDADAELTESEEKAVEIIRKAFEKQGISFDVLFRRRSKDYLTLLAFNPDFNHYDDFCRIKVGIKSTWVSLDTSRSPKFADDIRFINVKNKNCRHWKINLGGIEDFESVVDLIIESYQTITQNLNSNFKPEIDISAIYEEENEYIDSTIEHNKYNKKNSQKIREFIDDYVLFDFETTGLSIYDAKIIEIAAVKVRDNKIVDKFNCLVNPEEDIPQEITDLTGITNEMVENSPVIDEALYDFLAFIEDDVLIGHNINTFDMNILCNRAKELFDITLLNSFIDTMDLARCLQELDVPNYKLSTLCDALGVRNDNAHRGYSDVLANNECYQKMKEYTIGEYNSPFKKKKNKDFYFSEDITDKRICITGDFNCGNRNAVKAKLKEYGAKAVTTVGSKTDYLLVGDYGTTTTHKFDDAEKFGVSVVYEKDFITMGTDESVKASKALNETLYNDLSVRCMSFIQSRDIKEKYLEVKKSEGSSQQAVSVSLGGNLCYRIVVQKNGYKLEIPIENAKYISISKDVESKSTPEIITVLYKDINEQFFDICNDILTAFYDHYIPSERFGCCHMYVECSDSGKCLHEDKYYSKACQYRENLENGRIFYGKNCNV